MHPRLARELIGLVGSATVVGDEAHEPYDQVPLPRQALTGWACISQAATSHLISPCAEPLQDQDEKAP